MIRRPLINYLPDPDLKNPEPTVVVQARVPRHFADKMWAIAKTNRWTRSDVVRAGLYKFVDDVPADLQKKRRAREEELFFPTGVDQLDMGWSR